MIGTSATLAPARGPLGVGLGIAAASKTIFKLATDNNAFYNIYQDYKTSNKGVTNNQKKIMRYKIISFTFLTFLISCKDVNNFSSGSYPCAETFEIKLPKDRVTYKIDSIKINKGLIVPSFKWAGKETLLRDKNLKNGYFVFYIFLKERNQIMYCYAKDDGTDKTIIGLISIQNGLSLGNWQDVNRDLSEDENEKLKIIFREKMVSKIR
ncbi:hypothetical protein [Chryseobacterium arthrosphaerae]|nr:hypothetical protein [Chryseobacterium arthrosphaerae]